jgi:arylsulfatase A-like enzyme
MSEQPAASPVPGERAESRFPLRRAISLAAWAGMLTGYGELAYMAARKYYRGLFLFLPADAPWMMPLATAVLFVLAILLARVVLALTGRPLSARVAMGVAATLTALSLLLLLQPLHKGASLLIALGIGIQVGRSGWPSRPWFRRLQLVTWPVLVLVTAATAIVLPTRRALADRRERALAAAARPPEGSPNVLLIILDTVRSLNLSLYGYRLPTTPNLARRAEGGVRFDEAWSPAPWTLPSHASMFTGHEAHDLGTDWYVPLDDTTRTLAESFRDRGWRTGGFVANLPYTGRETGLARGFGRYEDHPVTLATFLATSALFRVVTTNRPLRDALGWHRPLVQKTAPELTRSFLRWVDREPGRPFFAFLNYYEAHRPYLPPADYLRRFLPPGVEPQPEARRRPPESPPWKPEELIGSVGSYDASIAYLDDQIERLFLELERRNLFANSIIILTSDHGEEFAEHGMIDHGNSLYRPGLAVPLLIWWPERISGGAVVRTPVSTRDLAATVADLAGLGGDAFPGRSLARFWTAGADATADPVYSEVRLAPRLPPWYPSSRGNSLGVREGVLRYIRNGDGVVEVYDLEADPEERHNLAGDSTRRQPIERMKQRLDSLATVFGRR